MDSPVPRDPVSGVPYCFLSTAVRFFFPKPGSYSEVGSLERKYHSKRDPRRPWGHFLLSGSTPEILEVPYLGKVDRENCQMFPYPEKAKKDDFQRSDLDLMVTSDVPFKENVIIETSSLHQTLNRGYCYLRFVGNEQTLAEFRVVAGVQVVNWRGSRYFLRSVAREKYQEIMESLKRMHGPNIADITTEDSPAITISSGLFEQDVVLCFQCPWPEEAASWLDRTRKSDWPSRVMREEIINKGCHVVRKAHPNSSNPELEWRFSFSGAEKTLALSLNFAQRICFRVFKALVKYHIKLNPVSNTHKLATYFLKTTLFWVCEETVESVWRIDHLGRNLLFLLDKLQNFLSHHHIPHFFIKDTNLIDNVPQNVVKGWQEAVSTIRLRPLAAMEEFLLEYYVPGQAGLQRWPMYMIVEKFLEKASTCSRQEALATIRLSFIELCFFNASEYRHSEVIEYSKVYKALESENPITLEHNMHREDADMSTLVEIFMAAFPILRVEIDPQLLNGDLVYLAHMYRISLDHAMHFLQLCEEHINPLMPPMFVTELAGMLHQTAILAGQTGSYEVEEILLGTVEAMYIGAMVESRCWIIDIKYAHYLVRRGRYPEAFLMLKSFLDHPEFPPDNLTHHSVSYSRYVADTVDSAIGLELTGDEERCYWVPVLAYYLLLVCCWKLNQEVPIFNDFVPLFGSRVTMRIQLKYIIGLFHIRQGDYLTALQIFMQVGSYGVRLVNMTIYCVACIYCKILNSVEIRVDDGIISLKESSNQI